MEVQVPKMDLFPYVRGKRTEPYPRRPYKLKAQWKCYILYRCMLYYEAERKLSTTIPSGPVIVQEWRWGKARRFPAALPGPCYLWNPLPKHVEKRALILDMNGVLMFIPNRDAEELPEWCDWMEEVRANENTYYYKRHDAEQFIEWASKYFHVYIWSCALMRNVVARFNVCFSKVSHCISGFLSQEDCYEADF